MLPAPRIKPRSTSRTPRLALQIPPNRHLYTASPAQDRWRVPFHPRPNRNGMARQRYMAILASIVDLAAPHLDRRNVHRRVVMHAPRLRIELNPAHLWMLPSRNGELPLVTGGSSGLRVYQGNFLSGVKSQTLLAQNAGHASTPLEFAPLPSLESSHSPSGSSPYPQPAGSAVAHSQIVRASVARSSGFDLDAGLRPFYPPLRGIDYR